MLEELINYAWRKGEDNYSGKSDYNISKADKECTFFFFEILENVMKITTPL